MSLGVGNPLLKFVAPPLIFTREHFCVLEIL